MPPPPTPPRPTPTPTPTPLPPRPPPQPQLDSFARDLVSATNGARAARGFPALVLDPYLTRGAQAYAVLMSQYDWFDHTGPDGSTLATRAEAAGYTGVWLGEILYLGPRDGSPASVVTLWLDNSTHRSVLLGEQYTEIGVGCAVSGDMRWCVEEVGAH